MSSRLPSILTGMETWPWYIGYLRDPLTCMAAARDKFGPLCALASPLPFHARGRRFVLASGGAINRQVLGQPDLFRPGGQVLRGPKGSAHARLRNGIFAMYGEEHRRTRRLMQPPFIKPAMAGYAPAMASLIDDVLDGWRSDTPLDMYREMRKLSNWVAAHILFGNTDFAASIHLGATIEAWLLLDAHARSSLQFLNLPGTSYRRLLVHAQALEQEMRATIARNRQTPGKDVLSLVIRASDVGHAGMTETDLIAHAVILYAASFETTANVLAWTLFLIAQHPAIAHELREEIATGLSDWPPNIQDLDALPLLNGVLFEAMRLMPPVALTFRTPTRATELEGMMLRTGDKVLLNHFATHRDPLVFAHPDRFDPKRWLTIQPDPYQYVAFSAGSRLCLGYSFALLELKLAVARVISRFSIGVLPGAAIDGVVQLTLRPARGIPMMVSSPDRAFAAAPVIGNINRMIAMPHQPRLPG